MERCLSFLALGLTLGFQIVLFPHQVAAGQLNYCYPVRQTRTVSDPGFHPQAYDNGYREGVAAARNNESFQARSAGGEFAQGYEDGYNGRPYAGQKNILPDRQESYQTQKCRNYSYNEKDGIETTLKRVLDNFQEDLRRDWQINND